MMVSSTAYALAFTAGLGIGAFYFMGLWWTVERLPRVRQPAVWVLVSFFVRAGLSLMGFYVLLQGGWPLLPTALAGFIVIRVAAAHRLKPAAPAEVASGSRRI